MDEFADSRPMHEATCSECGGVAKVPFEPSGDRPVYCRDCFSKQRGNRRGGGAGGAGGGGHREMFDAVCASCGQDTQVPFKPSGARPVYCRECFAKQG